MGSPAIDVTSFPSYCATCGGKLTLRDKFCTKCGAATLTDGDSTGPVAVEQTAQSPKQKEFERNLKVAWSCFHDVESKVEAISGAKDAADKEVNEGTFRGTMAMTALQGRLEKEFHDNLDIAWKSALKASEIDDSAYIEIDGSPVTPSVVLAGVCGLRGDLQFAFAKWDEAVAYYNQGLQYLPGLPNFYYNIGSAYTNKHQPPLAIQAFEKAVELDPTGHIGIEASKLIEKLKSGSVGKKEFTGSWKVVLILGGLVLISLFGISIGRDTGTGIMSLLFWGGILALYLWRKIK